MKNNIFRDGKVHVCNAMCATCIFHADNRTGLMPGRRDQMVRDAVAKDGTIVCHETIGGDNAVCRGFFEQHQTPTLQIAERLGHVAYVEPSCAHLFPPRKPNDAS